MGVECLKLIKICQPIMGDINFRMVFNRLILNEFVEREECYVSIIK